MLLVTSNFQPAAARPLLRSFDYLDLLGCAAQTIMATTHQHSRKLGHSRSSQRRSRLTASRRRNRAGRRLCCYRRYYLWLRPTLPAMRATWNTRDAGSLQPSPSERNAGVTNKQLDRGRRFRRVILLFYRSKARCSRGAAIVPDLTIWLLLCCPHGRWHESADWRRLSAQALDLDQRTRAARSLAEPQAASFGWPSVSPIT